MVTKEQYIIAFKQGLEEAGSEKASSELDELSEMIWLNPRGGLRLSNSGFSILKNHLEITSTEFVLQKDWSQNKILLMLERHMDSPFYLHTAKPNSVGGVYKSMSVFSGKVAMSIGLIGSVEQYIKNLVHIKKSH